MAHEELFKDCMTLVHNLGTSTEINRIVYMDPYGCNLKIVCKNKTKQTWSGQEWLCSHIIVSSGGRIVYDRDESDPNTPEYLVHGYWEEFIRKECSILLLVDGDWVHPTGFLSPPTNEHPYINYSLINLCKAESDKNRALIDKCYDICRELVLVPNTNRIEQTQPFGRKEYTYTSATSVLKVSLSLKNFKRERMLCEYAGRCVFEYTLDLNDVLGRLDDSNDEWEDVLFQNYLAMTKN